MNFKMMWVATLLGVTAMALAQGGAFEPDNVVRADTVTVTQVVEIPVRTDTVYIESGASCGDILMDDGRHLPATHVRIPGYRDLSPLSKRDGWHREILAYRSCGGALVVIPKGERSAGWIFAP